LTVSGAEVKLAPAVASGAELSAETIGQRLRRLRHERGLSQRELASPGVSYAYISRIEAGARRPSVKALRMLARKLGVSADYLETGSEIRDTDERELRIADAELELRLGEPGEAEERLAQLHEEALAGGDAVAAARAAVALGLAAAARGRNGDAIERLEGELTENAVSASAHPAAHAALGTAYASDGRPELAVELLERCLDEIAQEMPRDGAARARIALELGSTLTELGDGERAGSVLDAALEGLDALDDPYERVRLYWSLARLSDAQGSKALALDYARRAVALLEATDDAIHLAQAHLRYGRILASRGRTDEAGRHFELAEQLSPAVARAGTAP
jgi:transcriptional regulator with XRE-family HTH domain